MASEKTIEPNQKPLERYEHKDQQQLNNPPLRDVWAPMLITAGRKRRHGRQGADDLF
jgi:hypothetical protein